MKERSGLESSFSACFLEQEYGTDLGVGGEGKNILTEQQLKTLCDRKGSL